MPDSFELIVIGSYVQDHAWLTDRFPVMGETRRALDFNSGPGGKGFNQAVAAHRQGARTLFIGAIGDDHLGRIAQSFARDEGLATRWQVIADAPTAASSIIVDPQGHNQIVVALGANEQMDPVFLATNTETIRGARLVLLQLENNIDAIAAAIAIADALAIPVILNPAPVRSDLDHAMLLGVALLTPNETEFALLLERVAGTTIDPARVADLSDDALHAYSRKLGVPTVVVTLGENGCFVSHAASSPFATGDADRYRVPAETVNAVDSTGAGDAFNGALAAALVQFAARPFRDAVEHANRSAALSTETIGTAPAMPTAAQVAGRFVAQGPI
jgi:ribokinase